MVSVKVVSVITGTERAFSFSDDEGAVGAEDEETDAYSWLWHFWVI